MDQIFIKVILILAVFSLGVALIRNRSSARGQALRVIGMCIFIAAAIVAVLFPGVVNAAAEIVGVGRGTDLLLYTFIIVFVGQAINSTRRRRAQEIQITALARSLALSEPLYPDDNLLKN